MPQKKVNTMDKSQLKPSCVFDEFFRICEIPRPSKREEKMIEYLQQWGKAHGIETKVDKVGNVLMSKPATPGHENRKPVILQSHFDMVCEKLVDKEFDFDHDAIQAYVDGEWLTADGTTLGADDGIGVAIELALLASDDVEHGPIECVFTRDEETQLTGATGMEADFMHGDMLINLDSEDEGQIFVSCAGGRTTTATFSYQREEAPEGYFFIKIAVKGLKGGHSGDDIEKKRANAIKLLTRFAYKEMRKTDVRIAQFQSGKMHNAIPRDGHMVIAVPDADKETVRVDWNVFARDVEDEFHVSDTSMEFSMGSTEAESVLPSDAGQRLIAALQAVDNGVFAICQDEALGGMVETSSNVASVCTGESEAVIVASQRSNVTSQLENQCNTVRAAFELAGAKVEQTDGYPAWKMRPDSELTRIAAESYKRLFGKEPIVRGIHAGLECGLFSERYPNMDMISFGPTLRGVHTPDERLHIPTVEMVWSHLTDILVNIPTK